MEARELLVFLSVLYRAPRLGQRAREICLFVSNVIGSVAEPTRFEHYDKGVVVEVIAEERLRVCEPWKP